MILNSRQISFGLLISTLLYGLIAANSYTYLPDKIIQEEISVGSLIVDVAEQVRIYQASAITNENQQYTFLDDHKSSTENTYFLLDTVTGRVTSKRYLDRESMCINKHCMNTCEFAPSKAYILNGKSNFVNTTTPQASGDCNMNLKILVIPSYSIVSLNIIIQDINDNKPKFRIDSMIESVPENVPIGYRIPIDFAYDPDIGQNSIQYYSLLESDLIRNTFELDNGEKQLYLVVKEKLDRETVSQYNLTISACDGGIPSNCGTLKIILNVMDINDHNPIFLKDIYTFTVQEDLALNSVIGQLSAFDSDEGVNGQIRYSIVGSSSNSAENSNLFEHFELNPSTGLLTLKTPLDYEEKQFYSFSVEAKDGGVGSLPAYTTVDISILDVNDNSPEISVSFLNSLHRNLSANSTIQHIYMNENYEPNKFIAHVSITDQDLGAEIKWQVLMNNLVIQSSTKNSPNTAHNEIIAVNKLNSNSFTINTGLKSSKLLDREKTPTITVSIVSWDVVEFSEASNKAVYTFVIHLTDLNDNKPMFERDIYELSINENNNIGQFIHQFKAIDTDLNPQITYKIEHISKDLTYFVSIEETTGILRASKAFDREIKSKYEFYVIAEDNGVEINHSTKVKCILNILDLNDNAPVIVYKNENGFKESGNKTHLVLKVDENIPLLTKFVQISCYDVDQKENGKIKLMIEGNSQLSHTFAKERTLPFKLSTEGEFYVSARLDREAVSMYNVTLICKDQGIEKELNKTLNLLIKVNDVNDNCPRSIKFSPNSSDKSKFINKDTLTNESNVNMFNVEYTDDDLNQNGHLRFELMNHHNLFQLNSIMNENNRFKLQIRFNSNLSDFDQLKLGRYLIPIKISDNGFPACIKTDAFRLYIGSNRLRTEEMLAKHLSEVFKNPESAIVNYNNDKDDLMISKVNIEQNRFLLKTPYSNRDRSISNDKNFMNIFTKDDYIILLSLIGLLVLASMFLSIVGCVYFFKNSSDNRRLKGISTRRGDLKVKNYREMDVNDSSINTSTSNSQEDDENSQTEINQLLEHDGILNRFSMSLKNSNPDQSQSADSVISTSTYARDMTSSSASHNSDDCQRPKSIIYDNQRPSHSTFFGTNNSKKLEPSSFRHGEFCPSENSYSKIKVKIDQKSDSPGSLLSTFPNNYTLQKNQYVNYPAAHQKIYLTKKEMLDNLNPNSSMSILKLNNSSQNESSSDTSEIILPSTVSTTSSPIASSSISSSECEIFEKRHMINQTVENTAFNSCNNQSSLNRSNRGYLRSSAV